MPLVMTHTFKTLLAPFVLLFSISANAQTKIFVEYAGIFDQECAPKLNFRISDDQIKEVYEKIPEFQAALDKDAPMLLEAAKTLIGKPYLRRELTLSTTLCGFVPMANPFMVNVRPYLKSTSGNLPMISFAQISFHEWIHLYLASFYDFNSSLLVRYKKEKWGVLTHLHLMAIEKAVYTHLKRQDFLDSADHVYKNVIKNDYARSWEIIEAEGFEPFLAELKSLPQRK
jgi:hypothetical protein